MFHNTALFFFQRVGVRWHRPTFKAVLQKFFSCGVTVPTTSSSTFLTQSCLSAWRGIFFLLSLIGGSPSKLQRIPVFLPRLSLCSPAVGIHECLECEHGDAVHSISKNSSGNPTQKDTAQPACTNSMHPRVGTSPEYVSTSIIRRFPCVSHTEFHTNTS